MKHNLYLKLPLCLLLLLVLIVECSQTKAQKPFKVNELHSDTFFFSQNKECAKIYRMYRDTISFDRFKKTVNRFKQKKKKKPQLIAISLALYQDSTYYYEYLYVSKRKKSVKNLSKYSEGQWRVNEDTLMLKPTKEEIDKIIDKRIFGIYDQPIKLKIQNQDTLSYYGDYNTTYLKYRYDRLTKDSFPESLIPSFTDFKSTLRASEHLEHRMRMGLNTRQVNYLNRYLSTSFTPKQMAGIYTYNFYLIVNFNHKNIVVNKVNKINKLNKIIKHESKRKNTRTHKIANITESELDLREDGTYLYTSTYFRKTICHPNDELSINPKTNIYTQEGKWYIKYNRILYLDSPKETHYCNDSLIKITPLFDPWFLLIKNINDIGDFHRVKNKRGDEITKTWNHKSKE